MKVIQEFSSDLLDEVCTNNKWCDTFSERDYDEFIKSVDKLEYSDNVLLAISFSIYHHTSDVPSNFKTIVANELLNKAVVRIVIE